MAHAKQPISCNKWVDHSCSLMLSPLANQKWGHKHVLSPKIEANIFPGNQPDVVFKPWANGGQLKQKVGFFVWQTIFVQLSLRKVQDTDPQREKRLESFSQRNGVRVARNGVVPTVASIKNIIDVFSKVLKCSERSSSFLTYADQSLAEQHRKKHSDQMVSEHRLCPIGRML